MFKRRIAVALCAIAVVGVFATAALAGEVKGPPYTGDPVSGGITNDTNATAGPLHAHSLCAFSGLNDFDSDLGQTSKPTQTPADNAPGSPGLGFELFPGVVISCRGN